MKFDKKHFKKLFKEYTIVCNHPASKLIMDFIYDKSSANKKLYINGVSSSSDDIRIILWEIQCKYKTLKSVTVKRGEQFYKLFLRTDG